MQGNVIEDLIARLGWQVDNKPLEESTEKVFTLGKALRLLAGAAAFGYIIEQNKAYEAQAATLKTVLGSAEAANDAIARLNALTIEKTSFNADQMIGAFTTLSMKTLDASDRALLALGDLSASFGSNIETIVDGISSAARGVPQALEGALGTDIRYLGDRMEFELKGVKYNVARDAREIQRVLIEIGETQFAGGMASQAATLGGAISTVQGLISGLAVEFGQGFSEEMQESAGAIADILKQTAPLAKTLGKAAGRAFDLIARAGKKIADLKLPEKFEKLVEWMGGAERIGAALEVVLLALGGQAVIRGLSLLVAKMKAFSLAATIAQIKVFAIVGAILAVGLVLEDLFHFVTGGDSVIGDFVEKMSGEASFFGSVARGLKWFKSDGVPILKELGDFAMEVGRAIGGFLAGSVKLLLAVFKGVFKAIIWALDVLNAAFFGTIDAVVWAFKNMGTAIGDTFNAVFSGIGRAWDYWYNLIAGGISGLVRKVASVGAFLGDAIGLDVSGLEALAAGVSTVSGTSTGGASLAPMASGARGGGDVVQNVGTVEVRIAGSTAMGAGELSAAVSRGVSRGLSSEVAQLERLTAAGV